MSFHTIEPAKARLNRSELAVPGSNVQMIEKAAKSSADVVFLDNDEFDRLVQAEPATATRPNSSSADKAECPVCLGVMGRDQIKFPRCEHSFHESCLRVCPTLVLVPAPYAHTSIQPECKSQPKALLLVNSRNTTLRHG